MSYPKRFLAGIKNTTIKTKLFLNDMQPCGHLIIVWILHTENIYNYHAKIVFETFC